MQTSAFRWVCCFGDTNGNGSVNSTDVSQTKLKSGQAVDVTNFRTDVNLSNSINATDVSAVKFKAGTALPSQFLKADTNINHAQSKVSGR